MSEVKDVIVQGLWKNNSALVQLLGMCPLLAVTSTATNALGLGLATTLVLTLTNLTISACAAGRRRKSVFRFTS
jgi:electron transport complex protein RnfE